MLSLIQKLFGFSTARAKPPENMTQQHLEPASAMPVVEVAHLRLEAILERLSDEFKPLVLKMPDASVTVALPISTIVKQLPSGAVKVSLATLHRQAPVGVLGPLPPGDKRMVDVPLAEVFRHIKPTVFKRRHDQKTADALDSEFNLFGDAGNPYQIAPTAPVEAAAPEPIAPAPARVLKLDAPLFEVAPAPAPRPASGFRLAQDPPPPSAPRVVAPPPKSDEPKLVVAPAAAPAPVSAPPGRAPVTPPLTAATSERPSIVALSLPSAPAEPPPAALSALPATVPPTSAPGPVSPPPAGACDPSSIVIPVESLSTGWPGPIRQELAALNGSARVTLPKAEVSAGLARGRVTFTWGQIRGWLQPSSGASTDADEGTELILPLKVVAPLFLTGTKTPKHEQAPAFETDIPALFNPAHEDAAPVAEPVLAPDAFEVEEPAPTLILAEAPAEAPAETPAETATTVGELFGQPEKSEWTPGELVSNLARLDGVAGAVVALQEGLLVAHSLPADVKSEAIAAFLPQLFSRLNQYSAEMKLGEVDDLLFTTHGAHCQIYRLGFIYFAVLGKPGETLPWKEMRLVADELVAQTQKS